MNKPPPKAEPLTAARLFQMVRGGAVVQVLSVACKLELAETLRERPRTIAELAELKHAHAPTLGRVVRALVALGVFAEDAQGRLTVTQGGQLLDGRAAGSLKGVLLLAGAGFHWAAWGALFPAVLDGKAPFEHAHGKSLYDWLPGRGDEAQLLFTPPREHLAQVMPIVLASFDFTKFPTIVDVGGGAGVFLAAVLRACPDVRGVLVDQPEILAQARAITDDPAIAARCTLTPGSFFERVPTGGDLYVLTTVLMDWDDAAATQILKNVRAAMAPTARLLVVEQLDGPSIETRMADLDMLVFSPSGRLRSEAEFHALFQAAGLTPVRTLRSPSGALLEAAP